MTTTSSSPKIVCISRKNVHLCSSDVGVADGDGDTYIGRSDWLAQLEEGLTTESCTDWPVRELVKCSR